MTKAYVEGTNLSISYLKRELEPINGVSPHFDIFEVDVSFPNLKFSEGLPTPTLRFFFVEPFKILAEVSLKQLLQDAFEHI